MPEPNEVVLHRAPPARSEESRVPLPPLGEDLKVLLVWPKFPPSFWGFEGALEMMVEDAVSPPLGLITVAALCPDTWALKLVDRAFDPVTDEDFEWADLVMVSAMHAQRADAVEVLRRARAKGTRTFIGGPWASSEPEVLAAEADHVMVGEAEEVFADIARALQDGSAQSLYRVVEKPSLTVSPIPRFDLLRLDRYATMSVQFSRGCPFLCDFCDIITIYGRKPRAKSSAQFLSELDRLRELGWRGEVFVVDDNFIGNWKIAMQMLKDLAAWGAANGRPFSFSTQASVDLADRNDLMQAMVAANFMDVFLGIESPSDEALKGSRKLQNLRKDSLSQVKVIQSNGLWVNAGFIVGFDSDDPTIFRRQLEFIERASIPWAMVGLLQAPPTTPLYDRMRAEGRLIEDSAATSNFSAPNFRTAMPLNTLLQGLSGMLADLYAPSSYFQRASRALEAWNTRPEQVPAELPLANTLRMMASSIWTQGIKSGYRRAYWGFLGRLVLRYWKCPAKFSMGMSVLLGGHHFLVYGRQVADELKRNSELVDPKLSPAG